MAVVKNVLAVLRRAHQPDTTLSAYADGSATQSERTAVEPHVAECPRCAARLEELRSLRAALAALPDFDAPRSFRLRPSDVTRPARSPQPSFTSRAIPALAAVAVVAFAAFVAVDVRSGSGNASDSSTQLARSAADTAANEHTGVVASPPVPAAGAAAPANPSTKSLTQPTPGAETLQAAPNAAGAGDGSAAASPGPGATSSVPPEARAPFSASTAPSPEAASASDSVNNLASSPTAPAASTASAKPPSQGSALWLRWAEVASGLVAVVLGVVAVRSWFGARHRAF